MTKTSRWFAGSAVITVVVVAAVFAASWPLARYLGDERRLSKSYYIPSESMRPTLEVGDRLMPRVAESADIRRGVIVLHLSGQNTFIRRIVGIAGDRVEMRDGIVILNGRPVSQRPDGIGPKTREGASTRRLLEQFPGEPTPHAILDAAMTPQDNWPETEVPPGHLFLLGDNRDNSADSRFPAEGFGAGMVRISDVTGVADFILWSTGRRRFVRAIDDLAR